MKEYNDCFVQTSPVNGRAFSRLLVLLLSLVMALALVGCGGDRTPDNSDDANGNPPVVEPDDTENRVEPAPVVEPKDMEATFTKYKDVYAWLEVPDFSKILGTDHELSYPVAQHPTDRNYYLSRDLDGNSNKAGTIFSEATCEGKTINSRDLNDPVTVLYGHKSSLTMDEMRKIVSESKALGTHFFMFTGGEPLIRKKDIISLAKENPDCMFLAFTNATLIDDEFCEQLIECGNFGLALSIEGTEETNDGRRGDGAYQTTMNAMKMLKKHGCLFGTSVCYTAANYAAVTSDEFYDKMIEAGAKYMWYFHYMPVGANADTSLLLTPEQREHVYRAIRDRRDSKHGKPIFTVDFQNDAEFVGGCIAGGRNYFHVNSEGDVEPCVFIHYSDSNIREKSIIECLNSPLFKEYYKGQPFRSEERRVGKECRSRWSPYH